MGVVCLKKFPGDYFFRAKLRPVYNSNRGTKGTMHCTSNRCDLLYKFVYDQIQKVRGMDRKKLIKRHTQPPCDRIPFTVTCHPRLPNIGGFLKELHPLLQLSHRCNQAVPHVPMLAFRRLKNLQDYLVRAKLRPLYNSNRGTKGSMHCKSNRCDVCSYVVPSSSFTSHTTKRSYSKNYPLDCNSNNVMYLLTCKVCGLQYVGSTSTKFRLGFI